MQISRHCFAVTGLGYVPPWCVNAGFIVGQHTTLVVDTGANALAAATIHCYATIARREADVFYGGTSLANPSRPIREDVTLELGDCAVEILMTPGHTPTNVSVYVPQDGALFCGDCLVNGYLPNLDCGTTVDWQEWLVSLDRIARLGAGVVVPGHGPVAMGDDVKRLIGIVREELERSVETGLSPTSRAASIGS